MSIILHNPEEITNMKVDECVGKYVKYDNSDLVYKVERVLTREEKLKVLEKIFSSENKDYSLKHKLIQRNDSLCCYCTLA